MVDESISQWLEDLKSGDQVAAQQLWERYFEGLVTFARRKLGSVPRAIDDEEDIALSAFGSFCRQASAGRFPQLHDRDDLWKLLFTITERKLINHQKYSQRQKRGGGQVIASLHNVEGSSRSDALTEQLIGRDPSPELLTVVAEEMRDLLHTSFGSRLPRGGR